MKNTIKLIGIIAFVAVIGLGLFTSCDDFFVDDEQTVVTIIDIPSEHNDKFAWGGLSKPDSTDKKNRDTAIALHTKIVNGTVTLDMFKSDLSEASVSSSALVILCINKTDKGTQDNDVEKYVLKSVSPGKNTFSWNDFNDI